jgi:3-dehydroquinate synthase
VRRLEVRLSAVGPDRSYSIVIDAAPGAEERLAAEVAPRAAGGLGLLTDETVARLHGPRVEQALRARGLDPARVTVPDGEGSKSLRTVETVAEALAQRGLDRRAALLALGGGVVGDLGGFVASVFLRGVTVIQAPTTLLAQVDASVGGKTGVNLPSGKNLVGTFHQPALVYADVTALATLSPRDLASGLAEVVKHGAIASAELFELLERRAEAARAGDPELLEELVERSCAIKAAVVAADERETGAGGRERLNFGHTVGHALETASLAAAPLRHGEAVALGMLAAARVGARLGLGDATLEARLAPLLGRLGLPVDLDAHLSPAVLARVGVDKKRAGGRVSFVLVDRIGSSLVTPLAPAELEQILLAGKNRC